MLLQDVFECLNWKNILTIATMNQHQSLKKIITTKTIQEFQQHPISTTTIDCNNIDQLQQHTNINQCNNKPTTIATLMNQHSLM